MDTILNLLRDKNFHLQKFSAMNEVELLNFADGNFDNLEVFYQSRDTILDLIRCIDDMIEQSALNDDGTVATDAQRAEMLRLVAQKNELVQTILGQDLQLLSAIDRAKSEIIGELRTVQNGRQVVGRYRAPNLALKLDEEA